MNNKKITGILGGMGPYATIELYKKIIDKSIYKYKVVGNHNFPEMIIANHSPKVLLDNNKNFMDDLKRDIFSAIENLLKNKLDFFVIPCNTIHLFTDDIRKTFSTPFVSIIESVVDKIEKTNFKNIAVVGSKTTIQNGIYTTPLKKLGYNIILPDEYQQDELVKIIEHIISNGADKNCAERLDIILKALEDKGAETVVLGCTELPLIKDFLKTKLEIFDSIDILAEKICEEIFSK